MGLGQAWEIKVRSKTRAGIVGILLRFRNRVCARIFIKDLESTNGTRVNGLDVPKEKYIRLKPGDVIQIGRTDFSFT